MREIVEIGLPLALVFIMFSLGLELRAEDFKRVFVRPKAFVAGVVGQLLLLPIVAFVIASVLPLPPEIAIGLMIIAAVPGGITSNLLTRYACGDTALSISLTAMISLASIVTVPVIVFFALGHFVGAETANLSITSAALAMFAMVAVPVGSGILVRARAGRFAQSMQTPARNLSGLFLAFVVATAFAGAGEALGRYMLQAGLVALTLNVSMMVLAFAGAALLRIAPSQRTALSLECGLQNVTMAVTLVVLLGLPSVYAVPAAVYGMIMLPTAITFAAFLAHFGRARMTGEGGDPPLRS
ncbi:MAG TPA: bile acid:sodium symporter family protein [Devosiaceae bacterium]|nr:bile acid:sodium symporter family protein [Devosiaceae bacterium]